MILGLCIFCVVKEDKHWVSPGIAREFSQPYQGLHLGKPNICGLKLGVRKVIRLIAIPVVMKANNTSKKVIWNRKLDEMSQVTESLKAQISPITGM